MKNQAVAGPAIFAFLCLSLGFASIALSRAHSQNPAPTQKGAVVTTHATGIFEVKVTPQPSEDKTDAPVLARMTIDKQIHGDLEATSKGQMLTAGTSIEGSAGYVAIERISGTLHGRAGTFILQHTGTMNRGALQLSITVVPDSGTGQLTGLTGKMDIQIADGKHSYDFAYTLPDSH
jgi:hypothetical protein